MKSLIENDRKELSVLIEASEPIIEKCRRWLFPGSGHAVEIVKECWLVYDGKRRREEVLVQTPVASWQPVRQFCTERLHLNSWLASVLAELKIHNKQKRDCNEMRST